MQISDKFKGKVFWVNGIEFPLDRSCENFLCTGSTGSGKTVTHLNPLALGISAYSMMPHNRSAILYQSIKGTGAIEFEKLLPVFRQRDVRRIDHEGKLGLSLFERSTYRDLDSCASAVSGYLEEILLQVTDSFGAQGKDSQFWTAQRMNIFSVLSRLDISSEKTAPPVVREMAHSSHLVATAYRIRYFLQYVSFSKRLAGETPRESSCGFSKPKPTFKNELKTLITDSGLSLSDLEEGGKISLHGTYRSIFSDVHPLDGDIDLCLQNLGILAALEYLDQKALPDDPKEIIRKKLKEEPLIQIYERLSIPDQMKLTELVCQYQDLVDSTYSCVQSELKGLLQILLEGPLAKILLARKTVSLEEIIHKGRILIIDFPGAITGPERTAMVAIKLAARTQILARTRLLYQGTPINVERPIAWVLDEAHALASRGTNDDSLFLSQCREAGAIMIMGVQNLSLLASSIRDYHRFESLLGNLKTRIFCCNGDTLTNELASVYCGNRISKTSVRGTLWQSSESLKRIMRSKESSEVPCVSPNDFLRLETGQAYVVLATRKTHFLDARNTLPEPIVRILADPDTNIIV